MPESIVINSRILIILSHFSSFTCIVNHKISFEVLGMKRALIALSAIFAFLGAAQAADFPDVSPDPVSAPATTTFDWTGFYLGVQGGYQWHEDDVADPPAGIGGFVDLDGVLLGIHAGYDYQSGAFVFGLVGDVEWADGSGASLVVPPDVLARAEVNWQGSLRARLGYAIDNILLYGTGGLAFANYDLDYACCGSGFNFGDQFDETLVGYTVGGGAAYAFSENWIAWSDYRFTDYDTASSGIVNCCAFPPNRQDHDIQTHAIRVGVSRNF